MALRFSTGIVKTEALVVGLAKTKSGLVIESGKLKLDTAELLPALKDLGATGAIDEVIKLPGSSTKVIIFSGLGDSETNYSSEKIRRAAGAAARALFGLKSATFAIGQNEKANAEGATLASYSFIEFLKIGRAHV